MNPFKALGRGAKKVVIAPVELTRRTKRLLTIRARADEVLQIAENAEADPRLYRDAVWRRSLIAAVLRLVVVLPLPVEIRTVIEKLLGPSWKVTLAGAIGGFIVFLLDALQNGVSLKGAATGAAIAVVAKLAKGEKVTGGTVPATPEAEARVEK